jgi:biopolymer transport protein ExbB
MRIILTCVLGLFLLLPVCPPVGAQQPVNPAVSQVGGAAATTSPAVATAEPSDLASKKGVPVGLRELSPWSMFLSASLMVQAIMTGLAFASLVTWTIFIAKAIELYSARRRLHASLETMGDVKSLTQAASLLSNDKSVMHEFIAAAIQELRLSSGLENEDAIKERAASRFGEITRAESHRARFGMGVLATIGATSPFVGLFGTVWGVMNSFIGISKLQTTNLAVVAPGIAEALLATGIGLFAAIPAVIIYNHFARMTRTYMEVVRRAAGAVGRQLSRDIDKSGGRAVRRAAE